MKDTSNLIGKGETRKLFIIFAEKSFFEKINKNWESIRIEDENIKFSKIIYFFENLNEIKYNLKCFLNEFSI